MRLSVAVQHHPDRDDMLPRLLARLGHAQIVHDPDPANPHRSPWRTYRRALEMTPAWATHRLVMQDDALPCPAFAAAAPLALAARPDRLVAFCVCGQPRRSAINVLRASEKGESWAKLDHHLWIPAIAVAWPVELIEPALAFVDAQAWPEQFRADDEILGRIATGLRVTALATVPSLVDHPDLVPSLVGKRARGGKDPGRVAACFIADGCDPSRIDWNVGPR